MIVNYTDRLADYNSSQIVVYRRGYSGGLGGILETVTYDGLVDEDKVRMRAQFDLDQAELRSTFYYITTGAIAIRCKRGDLVGLQSDIIVRRSGAAVVKRIYRAGGDIIGLGLDVAIQVYNEIDLHAVLDMHVIVDMHVVGLKTGVAVRRADETISVHELADATGLRDVVTFATPLAEPEDSEIFLALDETDGENGSQVVSGDLGRQYRRMLVSGISPKQDFSFDLTLVDEASELVRTTNDLLIDDDGDLLIDDDGDMISEG